MSQSGFIIAGKPRQPYCFHCTRATLISKPIPNLYAGTHFYLDSLNINDLTLPNSTWLYLDPANSNEYILL